MTTAFDGHSGANRWEAYLGALTMGKGFYAAVDFLAPLLHQQLFHPINYTVIEVERVRPRISVRATIAKVDTPSLASPKVPFARLAVPPLPYQFLDFDTAVRYIEEKLNGEGIPYLVETAKSLNYQRPGCPHVMVSRAHGRNMAIDAFVRAGSDQGIIVFESESE